MKYLIVLLLLCSGCASTQIDANTARIKSDDISNIYKRIDQKIESQASNGGSSVLEPTFLISDIEKLQTFVDIYNHYKKLGYKIGYYLQIIPGGFLRKELTEIEIGMYPHIDLSW